MKEIAIALKTLADYAGSPVYQIALREFYLKGNRTEKSEIYSLNTFYLWQAEFIGNVRNEDLEGLTKINQDGVITLKQLSSIMLHRIRSARLWMTADEYMSLLMVMRSVEPNLENFTVMDFETFRRLYAKLPFRSDRNHLIHTLNDRVFYIKEIHELGLF